MKLDKINSLSPDKLKSIAELTLCKKNLKHWIENHFWIKDKDGRIRVIGKLKFAQERLLNLYLWCKNQNRPVRIIILKARKEGISTLVEALMFIETLTRQIDSIVIAHDRKTAEIIFRMTRMFYDYYDLLKPKAGGELRREMKFEDHEGYILVETANNIMAGTGLTPQFLHASESSKWKKGDETAIALLQSIGDSRETTVIIESTAYGEDPFFKPSWENAEEYCRVNWTGAVPSIEVLDWDHWNGYIPIFIPWFEDPDYALPFSSELQKTHFGQTLNEKEKILVQEFNLSLNQIQWRRRILQEKCQGDIKIFMQEYPATSGEAFQISGRPRFDIELINSWKLEDGQIGALRQSDTWDRRIEFILESSEFLTIFKRPQHHHRYVIGVDTAEGIIPEGGKDPDRSVAVVIDLDEGGIPAQTASIYGHLSEEYLVTPVKMLAEWYNNAFIVPESSGHGEHLISELLKIYPNHLIFKRLDSAGRQVRGQLYGWRTHEGNRKLLIDRLAKSIIDKMISIRDRRFVKELKAFKLSHKGRYEAAAGEHDDCVISLALAIQGMQHYPETDFMGSSGPDEKIRSLYLPSKNYDKDRSPITGY